MRNPLGVLMAMLLGAAIVAAACGGKSDDSEASADEEPSAAAEQAADQSSEQAAPAADEQSVEPEIEAEPTPEEPAAEEPAAEEPEPSGSADRELLAYGESAESTIDEVEGVRQFRFNGEEGDLVRILVDGKDGMDPITTLLEPNRTEIAVNDDLSSANRDSLIITRLPSTGLQVVRVNAFGTDIGRFAITVELLPEDDDNDSAVIAIGDTVQGVLGDPFDVDVFEFVGDAGVSVIVTVDGAVGIDTFAQVFDPEQTFLFADDDSGHGVDAELDFVLPLTGAYRVEVTSVNAKIGPYELSVQLNEEDGAAGTDSETLSAVEAVALTYLDALQQGDSLALFALAGPEALEIWGWESAEDVSRDIAKLQSIGVNGEPGSVRTVSDGRRGRTWVTLDAQGISLDETLRFDLVIVNGQWRVDFVQRLFVPEAEAAAN